MITPKQRAFLKKEAHHMQPSIMVGKGGVSEHTIQQVDEMLEKRELIKGRCLDTAPDSVKEVAQQLMEATGADFVQAIGLTFVLYRPADPKIIQLPKK